VTYRLNLLAIAILFLIAPAALAETAAGSVREGNSLYLEGKYDQALKKYQAAQVESPADRRIMFNLGDAQYKLENHEEALSEYLRAVPGADEKISTQSHYNAGNALYRAGRLEDAIKQYLKALEIDPEDEDAKYNLEFVRREISRREEQQQQRQEQQKQQEQKPEDENSSDIGEPQEENQKPQKREGQQPQEDPQQKQEGPERENGSQPEPAPEENQNKQPGRPKKESEPEQSVSDENIQRWLDSVEAESAENMKDFLKKQQPNQVVSSPEDW
jgi:Ca-activated chloride channel family protein